MASPSVGDRGRGGRRFEPRARERSRLDDDSGVRPLRIVALGGIWAQPVRVAPMAAQHAAVLRGVTEQGLAMSEAGSSVARVGDYQDLRYESGALDLTRIKDLAGPLSRADGVSQTARDRFTSLDRAWLLGPVADRLDELDGEVDRAAGEASVAAKAVREAPGLLGADGPRAYFVAFVNPAEERGGGGFLGNFGILTAPAGKLELTRSGPIRELIEAVPLGQRTIDGREDYVSRYGQFDPADFLQDLTYSPHFPYTADVIGQLYPQSAERRSTGSSAWTPTPWPSC